MFESLTLIPLSDMDSALLFKLGQNLSNVFQIKIAVKEGIEIPSDAYHLDRDQYNTTMILKIIYPNLKTITNG